MLKGSSSSIPLKVRIVLVTLLGLLAAYMLSQVAGSVMYLLIADGDLDRQLSPTENFAVSLSFAAVLTGVTYAFVRFGVKTHAEALKSLGFTSKPNPKDAGYAVLGFSAYFVVQLIVFFLVINFTAVDTNQSQNLGFSEPTALHEYIFSFMALVVLAPIAEEILFRGYVHRRLKHIIGLPASAIFVSLLFGLVHRQWNVAVDVFVLSMVIIFVLEIRDNTYVAIGMHALKNLFAFTIVYLL